MSIDVVARALALKGLAPVNPLATYFSGGVSGKKIVFWGDSTTSNATQLFADLTAAQATGEPLAGTTILNYGNNGASLASALSGSPPTYGIAAVISAAPNLIVSCWGINDVRLGLTSQAGMIGLLVSEVTQLLAALPNTPIILWGPNCFLSTDPGSTGFVSPLGSAQAYSTALYNAYLALANKWPNVMVLQKQDVLGKVCPPTSIYMTDILHPNAAGQDVTFAQILPVISGAAAFSSTQAFASRALFTGGINSAPWTYYAREVEDTSMYETIATGKFVAQGGLGTNGYQDFSYPGTLAGNISQGDVVSSGVGGTVWTIPFTASINASAANTRISNLGASLPPVATAGQTITVYRPRYGNNTDKLGNAQNYWGQPTAYPSRRRFRIVAGSTTFVDLSAYPNEPLASLSTFAAGDTLILPNIAPLTIPGTPSASGNNLRITGLSTSDINALVNQQGFLFSTAAGRY